MSCLATRYDPPVTAKRNRLHGREPQKWSKGPHWPLVETLIKRRNKLGLTQWDVDFEAGWAMGYCGKLEAGMRRPGLDLFYEWAEVLNCKVTVSPRR